MNPFDDIDIFHTACDQKPSWDLFKLYINLIDEEWNELHDALDAQENPDMVEVLDALVDILVVTMGAVRAGGMDGKGAWEEVMRTNFAKIDPQTGKVRKREDGKILKPEGWQPPNLESFANVKK
jgi:predicted HAD superfamily Cof-like phosphohydrolase